jgi:hypothetical protein
MFAAWSRSKSCIISAMPDPASPGPMQLPATWSAAAVGYAEDVVKHAELYAWHRVREPAAPDDDR